MTAPNEFFNSYSSCRKRCWPQGHGGDYLPHGDLPTSIQGGV